LVDLTHRASFSGGLANSLYAPRYNAGNLDSDVLQEFRRRNFTANRLTLVGVGINHEDLLRHAEFFRLPGPAADFSREKTRFLPSELRHEDLSELVHLALATEGVSVSNKDYLAALLASHALGTGGERIKRSLSNKLSRSLLQLAGQPASVSSFNLSYSDAGLFGFHIIANKHDVGKLARGLVKEVVTIGRNGLSSNELTAARNSLKAALADSVDNSHSLIDRIGSNPEQANNQTNLNELFKVVDSVSANDVNNFVKRVASGKLSLAAIGDLSELPRLTDLSSA
jgi:ubiquinol-cytochrome c reductase core subunit 2